MVFSAEHKKKLIPPCTTGRSKIRCAVQHTPHYTVSHTQFVTTAHTVQAAFCSCSSSCQYYDLWHCITTLLSVLLGLTRLIAVVVASAQWLFFSNALYNSKYHQHYQLQIHRILHSDYAPS